jgi:hypothetical protein
MKDAILELNTAVDDLLKTDIQLFNWSYKAAPDKWSKKEIIGHLIDSAQINLQRFVRCTYEENFKLTYEQVEWVEAQCYQDADINDLLALWRSLNLQIIRVLTNYPADRRQAKCNNSKTTVSLHTVEFLAQDYVDHLKHHLRQVYH